VREAGGRVNGTAARGMVLPAQPLAINAVVGGACLPLIWKGFTFVSPGGRNNNISHPIVTSQSQAHLTCGTFAAPAFLAS
jgi:hypothetical protein